jgi:hypothetical protein
MIIASQGNAKSNLDGAEMNKKSVQEKVRKAMKLEDEAKRGEKLAEIENEIRDFVKTQTYSLTKSEGEKNSFVMTRTQTKRTKVERVKFSGIVDGKVLLAEPVAAIDFSESEVVKFSLDGENFMEAVRGFHL